MHRDAQKQREGIMKAWQDLKQIKKKKQTDNVKKSAISLWQVVHKIGDFFLNEQLEFIFILWNNFTMHKYNQQMSYQHCYEK